MSNHYVLYNVPVTKKVLFKILLTLYYILLTTGCLSILLKKKKKVTVLFRRKYRKLVCVSPRGRRLMLALLLPASGGLRVLFSKYCHWEGLYRITCYLSAPGCLSTRTVRNWGTLGFLSERHALFLAS